MLTPQILMTEGINKRIQMTGKKSNLPHSQYRGFNGLANVCACVISFGFEGSKIHGVYIGNIRDGIAMGCIFESKGVLVSDSFGGCDFVILKDQNGFIFGAHVYSNAECRAAIKVLPAGWQRLCTWKSAGKSVNNPMGQQILAPIPVAFVHGNGLQAVVIAKVSNMGIMTGFEEYPESEWLKE